MDSQRIEIQFFGRLDSRFDNGHDGCSTLHKADPMRFVKFYQVLIAGGARHVRVWAGWKSWKEKNGTRICMTVKAFMWHERAEQQKLQSRCHLLCRQKTGGGESLSREKKSCDTFEG